MSNRTSWTAGNGQGLTFGTLINSSDMTSMPNGDTVLSSVTAIANQTNLDQFMDISFKLAISSSTIAAGANIVFWIYAENADGSHYGDGQFTAGTQAALTPAFPPCAICAIPAVASTTTLYGYAQGIIIPPQPFKIAVQNNCGFTLTSGTQTVDYITYNINLND